MVVTAVVVGADLLLILGLGVEQDIDEEGEDNELEQLPGKGEGRPIVPVFHDVEHVTIEVHQAVQVHFSEGLHGDLVPPMPSRPVLFALEGHIVLNGSAGQFDFVIGGWAAGGSPGPKGHQNGKSRKEGKEHERFQSTAEQVGEEDGNSCDGGR